MICWLIDIVITIFIITYTDFIVDHSLLDQNIIFPIIHTYINMIHKSLYLYHDISIISSIIYLFISYWLYLICIIYVNCTSSLLTRVYCAMEDGSAYNHLFEWNEDIKDTTWYWWMNNIIIIMIIMYTVSFNLIAWNFAYTL